jgi:hypothetical protein
MIAASAVSAEEGAVAGVGGGVGATAAKTMRMAPSPIQVQVQMQARAAAQVKAKRIWAANARQPRLLSSPSRRGSASRLRHRQRHPRYAAPSRRRPAAAALDRTTNTLCGPQPRAMFSAQDPRTGSATNAVLPARRN